MFLLWGVKYTAVEENKKRFFDESLKNIRERKIKSRTTTTAIWTRDPVTAANILTHTHKSGRKIVKNHISTRQLKYTTRRLVLSIFLFWPMKKKILVPPIMLRLRVRTGRPYIQNSRSSWQQLQSHNSLSLPNNTHAILLAELRSQGRNNGRKGLSRIMFERGGLDKHRTDCTNSIKWNEKQKTTHHRMPEKFYQLKKFLSPSNKRRTKRITVHTCANSSFPFVSSLSCFSRRKKSRIEIQTKKKRKEKGVHYHMFAEVKPRWRCTPRLSSLTPWENFTWKVARRMEVAWGEVSK